MSVSSRLRRVLNAVVIGGLVFAVAVPVSGLTDAERSELAEARSHTQAAIDLLDAGKSRPIVNVETDAALANLDNLLASVTDPDEVSQLEAIDADLNNARSSPPDKTVYRAFLVEALDGIDNFVETVATLPETIDHGPVNQDVGDYIIHTTNGQTFVRWWNAPYHGTLQYAANVGWDHGDRCAYGGAYGHLILNGVRDPNAPSPDHRRLHDGEVIGRFNFKRVHTDAAYAIVNDKYMLEAPPGGTGATRTFDGVDEGITEETKFCGDVDQAYEEFTGPDDRPFRVIFWTPDGQVAEIRDYGQTVSAPDIKFRLLDESVSPDGHKRITVVAYENDLPVVVVYYDAMGGGDVTISFD